MLVVLNLFSCTCALFLLVVLNLFSVTLCVAVCCFPGLGQEPWRHPDAFRLRDACATHAPHMRGDCVADFWKRSGEVVVFWGLCLRVVVVVNLFPWKFFSS